MKFIHKFIQWLVELFKPEVVKPKIVEPIEPSNAEKLRDVVLKNLGVDPTPEDKTPDDVACAESLSVLLQKVFPDFPILPSTRDLDAELSKRFKRELEPKVGRIIISPRKVAVHGHCGYFTTDYKIASNSSKSGLFVENYKWDSWVKEMSVNRHLPIFIYSVV